MPNIRILTVIALTAVLAGAAYAAPGRGGGGGGRGGGGGGHAMGGGHFGGGGMHVGGGGAHFGGAPHFGGAHFGGRPAISNFRGGARPSFRAVSRPGFRGRRSFAVHGNPAGVAGRSNRNAGTLSQNRRANVRSNAVRNVLGSRAVAGALHNRAALINPNARARIAASAAMAGWHDGRGRGGWWRHRNGGYGWVGPLFWPFAYYDIYDYTLWGYGYDDPFWDYGYGDIYAGVFSPYGYDDLSGYLPQGGGRPVNAGQASDAKTGSAATSDQLAEMCGEDGRDIAGLPIDQIQKAISPNDTQRAALDDLANASVKAAQGIRAACPTQIALTSPARLAAMQARIEAMISAVGTVEPPLQTFYGLLDDDQKARLNALGQDQRKDQHQAEAARAKNAKNGSRAESCSATEPGVTAWPAADIDARVHPTDAQRASLAALQDATAKAADILKASCQTNEPITPPARLEAVGKRLDAMLQAVRGVRAPLDDFYGRLSDEQKAQFEAIGQSRSADSRQSNAAPARLRHHYHHASIGGIIQHLIWMAR
jgi:hypothetical protein